MTSPHTICFQKMLPEQDTEKKYTAGKHIKLPMYLSLSVKRVVLNLLHAAGCQQASC